MAEVVGLPSPAAASPAMEAVRELGERALGRLLGALASRPGTVPKYLYPSAGTLYPVQAYVILRERLGTLEPGSYYHDPEAHALALLSPDLPAAPDGATPSVLLVLVEERAAIESIYRDEAETFCLLEAGYIKEALQQAGAGLALRDAGDPSAEACASLVAALRLGPSHRPLVCWAVEAAGQ